MKRFTIAFAALTGFLCANVSAEIMHWADYPGLHGPGHAGIQIGDFDGNGAVEAAVSAYAFPGFSISGSQLLAVLAAGDEGLRVRHVTVIPGEKLVGPLTPAPEESGADRLVAVLAGSDPLNPSPNRIVILGEVPLRILRSIPAPGIIAARDVADIDGDGQLEMLALASGSTWSDRFPAVLDYVTGSIKWVGSVGVPDARAAQLDDDAPMEIILAGTPGSVIDGSSHGVEWTWPAGFGEKVLVGRFADAATPTFATYAAWSGAVQIFRAQPYSSIGDIPTGQIDAAAVIRMNDADQIGIGDGQLGSVHVHDPRTGATLFTVENPEHGVSALAGGDLDGDSSVEIVYGAGLSSTGWDILRVVDTATSTNKYYQADEVGPHVAITRGDFSGTGRDELAYLTTATRSNVWGPTLRVLDAATGRRLRSRMAAIPSSDGRTPLMASLQIDDDPQLELVVVSSNLYTPTIFVVDGLTLDIQWSVPVADGGHLTSMDTLDIDGDGVQDIVVATSAGFMRAVNGIDGSTLWQSDTFSGTSTPLLTAFAPDSGAPHVILARDNVVRVFNLSSGLVETLAEPAAATVAMTRWGDGQACRVGVLGADNAMRVLGCLDLVEHDQFEFPAGSVFFRPFSHLGFRFVAASRGRVYGVDGIGAMFMSGMLGDNLGAGNQGIVTSQGGGGSFELFIGSQHMVARVGFGLDRIFANGFD